MEGVLQGVQGFMYPNEVELQWSLLIVLYPFITGLVAGAFILASLERVFNVPGGQADLPARAAHRAGVPARRAAAAAAAPRPPRAVARDVPDAAHRLGDGDVRVRLPLVPDGRARARDLARLPQGHRADVARSPRVAAPALRRDGAVVGQHQRGSAAASTTASGKFLTVIGIPSAFLLHGYVGFIFGSVKANPWWSTPLMPIVFLFSAIVSGHRARDARLHGHRAWSGIAGSTWRASTRSPATCSTPSSSTSRSRCST